MVLQVATKVEAATILDTGVKPCDGSYCSGVPLSATTNPGGKQAARFTLDQNTTLTGFSVWMESYSGSVGKTVTLSLYQGDVSHPWSNGPYSGTDYTPDATNQIMSQHMTIGHTGETDNFNNRWQTLGGLSFALDAGSYWLGLSLTNGDTYDGGLPTDEFGALNPVGSYAFYNPLNVGLPDSLDGWATDHPNGFAFEVMGNVAPVPLPAAVWLFGSALVGLGFVRKAKA